MKYTIKIYFGSRPDSVKYLGEYPVSNRSSLDHYKELKENGMPFDIWFEHFDGDRPYRNIVVDQQSILLDSASDHPNPSESLTIICQDLSKLKFLTSEEFHDKAKVESLIDKIDPEDIKRFLK